MENHSSGGIQALHFVKAFVISAGITAIFLFLCAFLLLKTNMSEGTIAGLLSAVDAAAVFAGGVYLGKKAGKQKFLWGLIFGVLYFLIYLLLAFLVQGPELKLASMLKSLFVMAGAGMAGGMVS